MTKVLSGVSGLENTDPNRYLGLFNECDSILQKIYRNGEIEHLANYFRYRIYKEGQVSIRAPKPNELDWYWTIIPYDLEDVIFVVETSQSQFFLEFNDGKMFYIDDWTYLNWQ